MVLGAVSLLLASCSSEPECLQVDRACAPLYSPAFSELYRRTLAPTCAQAGGFCHAADGGAGGMSFVDEESAYRALTSPGSDGEPRAVAGDPSCSLLVRRTSATDSSFVMPPGMPLSEAERCVLIRWVGEGAKR